MEHLTKQQIILLTLFTSFVTSIATGIVTVALMDQAPVGVTSTIDNVIEHTVEEVTPAGTVSTESGTSQSASAANAASTVFSNPADQIENATALAEKSLVRITLDNNVTGLGVVVASSGIIISDKSAVGPYGTYSAVMPDGTQYPLQVLQSQNDGDIVFLLAGQASGSASSSTSTSEFVPATFASIAGSNMPQLGETVIALSGTDATPNSTSVDEGIIEKINQTPDSTGNVNASSTISSLGTNIDSPDITVGSPLFDSSGHILGIKTLSNISGNFYPIGYLESLIPAL
jgi:hypothetical protein